MLLFMRRAQYDGHRCRRTAKTKDQSLGNWNVHMMYVTCNVNLQNWLLLHIVVIVVVTGLFKTGAIVLYIATTIRHLLYGRSFVIQFIASFLLFNVFFLLRIALKHKRTTLSKVLPSYMSRILPFCRMFTF